MRDVWRFAIREGPTDAIAGQWLLVTNRCGGKRAIGCSSLGVTYDWQLGMGLRQPEPQCMAPRQGTIAEHIGEELHLFPGK